MKESAIDPHYTPQDIAKAVAASIGGRAPAFVLDPAAGDGALLVAVAARFPHAKMLAMDVDKKAAGRLQRKLPSSVVSVCDALTQKSIVHSHVWHFRDRVDVVVANPPFGNRHKATVLAVDAWGKQVRCGTTAAHVLSSAMWFSPKRMIVVVPNSLLYSERDADVRRLLGGRYVLSVLRSLGSGAFAGTGASVSLIELKRKRGGASKEAQIARKAAVKLDVGVVELIRGGVPMHEAEDLAEGGRPLLHTTNLLGKERCRIVKPSKRGIVSGPVILLPRAWGFRLRGT